MQNKLKQKLKNGEKVIGTWAVIPSADVSEIISKAGFDYFIIDMEHGPASFETAIAQCRAANLYDTTPLVRVPNVDESYILRALDVGAGGIIVPQIQDAKSALKVVEYAKYLPLGNRGHSPFTRAGGFSHIGATEVMQAANDQTIICLLVEGKEGIENLDDILAKTAKNIDIIYFGLYDLAKSVGQPGNVDHPDVIEHVKNCAGKVSDAGVTAGILVNDIKKVPDFLKLGIKFFAYQNDTGILFHAVKNIVEEFSNT